jgi:hypothetical protein
MRYFILVGLLVSGCGSGSNGTDQSVQHDMAGQPAGDLSMSDRSMSMAQDQAIPPDLTQSPDLTELPDLTPLPDLAPPPDLAQNNGGCKNNGDCNNGEYCQFPMLGCNLTGACKPKGPCPQFCTANCGCDGKQYCNECQANENSNVAISHVGACP